MKRKLTSLLKKWHRRLGITSAFFVILLSVTGLLLLFSAPLGFDQKTWGGPMIAKVYNLAPKSELIGIALGERNWVVMVDGLVYVGIKAPIALTPPLRKAKTDRRFVYFANDYETIVTFPDGTLVERLAGVNFEGTSPSPIPDVIKTTIIHRYSGRGMAASRVVLDIHTGRFFGTPGTWLMALASVFLLLLALSGLYMWIKKPNGNHSRNG